MEDESSRRRECEGEEREDKKVVISEDDKSVLGRYACDGKLWRNSLNTVTGLDDKGGL